MNTEIMQPLPFPGDVDADAAPSDESIAGYRPLECSISRASGIVMVMQVAVVLLGCVLVKSKGL
jgi:hypothetical protein